MRDTSNDLMEDAMSNDNIMECGFDADDMDQFEDSTSNIHNSTSIIQDAAVRLLTLLRVNELDDDFLSSSEDEGVESGLNYYENDDDKYGSSNSRLLQQLAANLTKELKYVKIQSNNVILKNNVQSNRTIVVTNKDDSNERAQRMDITYSHDEYQTIRRQSSVLTNEVGMDYRHTYQHKETSKTNYQKIICKISDNQIIHSLDCKNFHVSNKRCRINECHRNSNEEKNKTNEECKSLSLWSAGWDSCAAEAVKYLIDIEGLDPKNPTVLALEHHLEIQRNHALYSYTI